MERISKISDLDKHAMSLAKKRWDSIAKPLNSLGLLEKTVIQIAGITGDCNVKIDKRHVVIMCSDNGVVCEGVTQTGKDVTIIVAKAIADGTSNINMLANTYNCSVTAVDIGIDGCVDHCRILDRKISNGTNNIANGPAMSIKQAESAVKAGIDIVESLKSSGTQIIITGEMGIGNTTTSSALASVLLDEPVESVTGKGSGLDDEGLKRKIGVIKRSLNINKPDSDRPIELLAKLGGYDIAGMTGLFLGGAVYRIPVVIDGLISAVSAVLASKICPLSEKYMLCSHVSKEPAGGKLLSLINKKPVINAEMCLGEGTGAVMLLPLIDGALSVYNFAHKFENLPMERYVEL